MFCIVLLWMFYRRKNWLKFFPNKSSFYKNSLSGYSKTRTPPTLTDCRSSLHEASFLNGFKTKKKKEKRKRGMGNIHGMLVKTLYWIRLIFYTNKVLVSAWTEMFAFFPSVERCEDGWKRSKNAHLPLIMYLPHDANCMQRYSDSDRK